MNFINRLINYFRKPKEETKVTPEEGTCPLCWGRQEYDGKIRKLYKDKQIDVNHHANSYIKSKNFVVENIDGKHLKKGEISECPECGRKQIKK